MIRLFIALALPAEVSRAVADLLPVRPAGVRAVPPELMHLTLAFLGWTPEDRLEAVRDAAGAAGLGARPFRVVLGEVGRFPETGRVRVAFVGLRQGAPEVEALGSSLRGELERRGIAFDARPLRPHITLARLSEAASAQDARAFGEALRGARVPELRFEVAALEVMRSVLSRAGPRYSSEASLPLGPPGS